MIACLIGSILSIENRSLTIEDKLTKQQYKCEPEDDDFLNLKVGDSGVFIGQYLGSTFRVKRVEIRKFLDPLYEADLYDASGKFNLVPVLNDPFTEAYLNHLEEQKALDALAETLEEIENADNEHIDDEPPNESS